MQCEFTLHRDELINSCTPGSVDCFLGASASSASLSSREPPLNSDRSGPAHHTAATHPHSAAGADA